MRFYYFIVCYPLMGPTTFFPSGKQPTSFRCLASFVITALCSLNKRCLAMENTAKGKNNMTGSSL